MRTAFDELDKGHPIQDGLPTASVQAPSTANDERLAEVQFDPEVVNSPWIKPMRMRFKRRGQQMIWDMAMEHDNVAVLLYHKEQKKLLLVKQFRPPVFINIVRNYAENIGKQLNAIQWGTYSMECGETLELCAGLMDKPGKSALEHVHEEIIEECGYDIPLPQIRQIKRYVTGISISGAVQHLFYAELDESLRVTEGGGVSNEGEYIQKVFLSAEEAKALVEAENVVGPPSLLFALSWWLKEFTANGNSA